MAKRGPPLSARRFDRWGMGQNGPLLSNGMSPASIRRHSDNGCGGNALDQLFSQLTPVSLPSRQPEAVHNTMMIENSALSGMDVKCVTVLSFALEFHLARKHSGGSLSWESSYCSSVSDFR
jgi:hypothetical protein